MKLNIKDFAKLTGVSVRTLHYYDEIGLLRPTEVDPHSGYRRYGKDALLRMQEILFYRELDFSLKVIADILSSPDYDKQAALREQKKLLILKKERLEKLIGAIDAAAKGEIIMDAFSNHEFEQYKAEVKERWGDTAAYTEYTEKSKNYGKDSYGKMLQGMEDIFGEFALCRKNGCVADGEEAQCAVRSLQEFITANFYTCTKEILAGLGQMYVADDRFRQNIDRSGEGTAEYAARAIEAYCK